MAKILVIDDEAILRSEMVDWLLFEGYEVIGAENGLTGVQRAIDWVPDLIISDVTMPYLDGFGVLYEVHSNPATARVPFIYVTARATHGDIRHGMDLGADDYITKPFSRVQLLEAVENQLAKYQTRERIYRQELLQLQEALTEEHEQRLVKARLVAMFSHDFRNPLATIQSSQNLLADYADRLTPDRRVAIHNRIEISVRQLIQMLDDMLIVSQMETGHLSLTPENMDVGAFFQHIVDDFQVTYGDIRNLVYEDRVSSFSNADKRLLRQIGSNLISNAIKYSPHGSTVRVSLDIQDENYILAIQDQGIGISEEDQQHLFEIFHRGNNVGQISGTGLGLAIVKRAVDFYGGSIRVESALNQGTTMIVTFPVNPPISAAQS